MNPVLSLKKNQPNSTQICQRKAKFSFKEKESLPKAAFFEKIQTNWQQPMAKYCLKSST